MPNNPAEPIDQQLPQEWIVLVHGTGSYSPLDEYPENDEHAQRWWHHNSPFRHQLIAELNLQSTTIGYPPTGEFAKISERGVTDGRDHFVWSGVNDERDRRSAAQRLKRLLLILAAKDQPVHLIGHSYGGTIILEALQEAERSVQERQPISRIVRSVTTVGSPFIRFSAYPYWRQWLATAAILLLLCVAPVWSLITSIGELGYPRGLEAIVLHHSPLTYLPLIPVVIGFGLSFVWGIVGLWTWRENRSRIVRFKAIHDRYKERTQILYSRYDEAINALQLATNLRMQAAPRFSPWESRIPFLSICLYLVSSLFAGIWNRVIAPSIDALISNTSREAAYGSHIWGDFPVTACSHPVGWKPLLPLYESGKDDPFQTHSDLQAAKMIQRLREELHGSGSRQATTASLFDSILTRILSAENTELVHNQYFHEQKEAVGQKWPFLPHLIKQLTNCTAADERELPTLAPDEPEPDVSDLRRLNQVMSRTWIALAAGSLLAFFFADYKVNREAEVVVASKAFTESYIAAEVLAQRLENNGFTNVKRSYGGYSSAEIFSELAAGNIQLYVEYTGSLYDYLSPPYVDPKDEPLFQSGNPLTEFRPWFEKERQKDRRLRMTNAGSSLGYYSPYYLVMDANSDVFQAMKNNKVIREITGKEAQKFTQSKGQEDLQIEWVLELEKLKTFLASFNQALPSDGSFMDQIMSLLPDYARPFATKNSVKGPLKLGLSDELVYYDAAMERMRRAFNLDDELELQKVDHHLKYAKLANGDLHMIDGYGTDGELYHLNAESHPSTNPNPNVSDASRKPPFVIVDIPDRYHPMLGDLVMKYEAFPFASHPQRSRRDAILAAVAGEFDQMKFKKAIKELREQMQQMDSTMKSPRSEQLAALVKDIVRRNHLADPEKSGKKH